VANPLEKYLRIHKYGTYRKSDDDTFAYDRVEDLWQEELDENEDDNDFIVDDKQVHNDDAYDESSDSVTSTVIRPAQIDPKKLVDLTKNTDDDDDIPDFTPVPARKRRRRRKPARFRDLEGPDEVISTATALRRLYNRIDQSKDRLFIIKHTPIGQTLPTWFVVQIYINSL